MTSQPAAARFVNNEYAGLIKRHSDRFGAFAALPMPHVEESAGEMRRALDELGMAGVALHTTVRGGNKLISPSRRCSRVVCAVVPVLQMRSAG
jgi:predicted TIM-barrel fold metal-dependent hydrolase